MLGVCSSTAGQEEEERSAGQDNQSHIACEKLQSEASSMQGAYQVNVARNGGLWWGWILSKKLSCSCYDAACVSASLRGHWAELKCMFFGVHGNSSLAVAVFGSTSWFSWDGGAVQCEG